ncbi:MAG TPA: amino acid ABC transporter permease [Solirubrobacteraceae bacterium]|jgi:His/Glu/Gln/Arg/opine family amino acid ABC transporter permease subunit
MGYLFDPHNWEWLVTGNNARFLFEGFLVNVQIALIAMLFALVVGLALALARLARNRALSMAAGVWIDIWRNLPLMFVILYLGLALPQPWRDAYESAAPGFLPEALRTGRVFAALLALVLYNSAVLAEIMRAGILSLDRGQSEAAAALGMSYWQRMRLVILPQGLRRMLPATVSQLITLNKDTTLVSIIAIEEVMRHGRVVTGVNFFGGVPAPVLQVFLFIGLMFLATNLALSRLSRRLEIRERRRIGTTVKPISGAEDQLAVARVD